MRTQRSFSYFLSIGVLALLATSFAGGVPTADARDVATGQATGKRQHKPHVMLDGTPVPGTYYSVEGISQTNPMPETDSSGTKTWQPGKPTYGNITIVRVYRPGQDPLRAWFAQALRESPTRRSVSVTIDGPDGSTLRYNFHECWPVRWDPPSVTDDTQVLTESITINPQKIEMLQ